MYTINPMKFNSIFVQIGSDTPVQLAAELVTVGHINPKTASATTESIQYLIDHYPVCKVTTFKLSNIGSLPRTLHNIVIKYVPLF